MRCRLIRPLIFLILLMGTLSCSAQLSSLGAFGPGLSPCRQFLAYIAEGPTSRDLLVRDLTTYRRTNLTQSNLVEANPSWSPDSSMIAFNSFREGGNIDVCIIDLASGTQTVLTDGEGLYLRPFWISPSEVGYTDETRASARVVRVELDSGAECELQVGEVGASGIWQASAATGPGFVAVTGDGIVSSQVEVIRYYTGTSSRLVEVVADGGYRYCPVRERYYQDTSYSASVTWEENRATGQTGTAWTILWSGFLYLPYGQTITFTLYFDQRIYCWVDSVELYSTTSTDGHGKIVQATTTLSAGIHAFNFAYFDDYEGGGGLSIHWEGDDFARQELGPMAVD